jgi:hypothetical protein
MSDFWDTMARMSPSLPRPALLLLLLAGCSTTPPAATDPRPPAPATAQPEAAPDPLLQGLTALVQANPNNGAPMYDLAALHASRGETAQAMKLLERLVELRWSYAPEDTDFGEFARTPEYRAVADRLAANEPRVSRSRAAFTLTEKDLIPEGITHDPVTDTFFVGSIRKRKVVAIAKDGKVRDFTTEGQDGLWAVLGLKVDAARRHLWVACFSTESMKDAPPGEKGRGGVFLYDLTSGRLLRKITLDNRPFQSHLVNDLALSSSGDVFITDSDAGGVRMLRVGTQSLEPLVPDGTFFYPNGLALSEDGARLYVAHYRGLASVDPRTGQHTAVQAPEGTLLSGLDGVSLYKGSLIGVQNGHGRARIVRFHFGADPTRVERAEILESGNPVFNIPTTGTVVGDAFVYIANSQLRRLGPKGELPPLEQLDPTTLLRVELSGGQGK